MQRILIIDDESDVCNTLVRILSSDGYETSASQNAKDGLELLESLSPNLVLLDIKMLEMDGIEALRRIREIDKNIPVVMMTGYGDLDTAKESMKLGAYDYITKPFDLNFLKAIIREALGSDSDIRPQTRDHRPGTTDHRPGTTDQGP